MIFMLLFLIIIDHLKKLLSYLILYWFVRMIYKWEETSRLHTKLSNDLIPEGTLAVHFLRRVKLIIGTNFVLVNCQTHWLKPFSCRGLSHAVAMDQFILLLESNKVKVTLIVVLICIFFAKFKGAQLLFYEFFRNF